ncbi:MAG: hypothetical protein GWP08_08010 [Nitrospiraceae bacterium]|nr:hypothetical protein [Nitrospiraceae bacterium]
MDSKQHAAHIVKYQRIRSRFKTYADTLMAVLLEASARYAPLAIVQARAKTVPSFAEKIVRKGYVKPLVQMTDLCGARVVTITAEQMKAMCRFIEDAFEVDYVNSLDVGGRLHTSEFGYRSLHYVVQFRRGKCLGVEVPRLVLPDTKAGIPFKAEIQVRTVLQHGWAEVVHDRIYKNRIKVPEPLVRDGARLAAVIEEADRVISKVVDNIDAFVVDIGAYMKRPEIEAELESLRLILDNEKDPKAKESLTLRMAKMQRAIGDWPGIVTLLKPYSKGACPALLREWGNAQCERRADAPSGRDYTAGRKALLRSAELDDGNAETHAMLARSYQRQPRSETQVRRHFRRAYHLAPKSPYHLAAYLEYELLRAPSSSLIPMLDPAIREAIETCRRHTRVKIELPQAYMTMGKLYLLLGEPYDCLDAYAKGLRMVLDCDSGVCPAILDHELDALARLENALELAPGEDWVRQSLPEGLRRLLLIGKCLACNDRASGRALAKMKCADLDPAKPVLIVAGGCAKAVETEMKAYRKRLRAALAGFRGTVIGGGTASGISGVLGAIAKADRKREYSLVGYYPERMPSDVSIDQRYDQRVPTPARDFGPLDAIQVWIDLTCAGIAPDRVSVLGIDGGSISGFEFRLALALGACVGVVAGSGRAADAVAGDPDWGNSPRLLTLPDDSMTLRAFVNPGEPILRGQALDKAAQAVHADYCESNPKIFVSSGKPWEDLDDTFKDANRAQAAYIGEILKANGYTLVEKGQGATINVIKFSNKAEIDHMAEMEHGRWNVERLCDGWVYGKEKDEAKKTQPCLVPWEQLPDGPGGVKRYDRSAVQNWPKVLAEAGIEVRKA